MMAIQSEAKDYYEDLRRRFFSEKADWAQSSNEFPSLPKAKFLLNREFNDTSKFLAFDFFVELYQRYGHKIIPVAFENGCVSLTGAFTSKSDFKGTDFRYLVLTDPRYSDLFRRYDVQNIYFHWFPYSEAGTSNVDANRFKLNELGIPTPY